MPEEAGNRTRRSSVPKKPGLMMSLEEATAIADMKGSHEIMDHMLFEAYPRRGSATPS